MPTRQGGAGLIDRKDARVGHTYYAEVEGGACNHFVIGKLASKGVMFRGVRYWGLFGDSMIHLIDPDDLLDLQEVRYA